MKLALFLFGLLLLPLAHNEAQAGPNCSGAPDGTDYYNFKEACFKHDVCYSEGKITGLSKADCDDRFHQHMKASCRGRSFMCDSAVKVYYQAVRQLNQKVYDEAAEKGQRIIAEIARMGNREKAEMIAALKARTKGQEQWTKIDRDCGSMSNDAKYKACKDQRDAVMVADIPWDLRMGNCNILGMRWKHGSRSENARVQSDKYGIPLHQIEDRHGKDPCK